MELQCELCGYVEEVNGVTGVNSKGDKVFYFPDAPYEMCVCKDCMNTKEDSDV